MKIYVTFPNPKSGITEKTVYRNRKLYTGGIKKNSSV